MYSAVTVTKPKLKTAVFCQNCGKPKPRCFWATWVVLTKAI